MHIDFRLLCGTTVIRRALVENVNHVVVRLIELCLGKVRQQAIVAAVTVDDQDFLASVTGHLVGGFLQKCKLHAATVCHRAGLVLGLGDLAEIVLRKDNRILLLCRVKRRMPYIEKIGAERKMRTMFFEDAERKQANSLRVVNAFAEIRSGEFFPVDGELRLRSGGLSAEEN